MPQTKLEVQIVNAVKRSKKDGSGDYHIISGLTETGVFETFVEKETFDKIEQDKLPVKAQLIFEARTYQGRINWRLVDIV